MAPDIVDFEWNNTCGDPFHERALGYLRGNTMFLRISDDDTKIDIACEIDSDEERSTFRVTDVCGFHTGISSSDDRNIDSQMLRHDADLRISARGTRSAWTGRTAHTHFECLRVLSSMLRTLRPGWVVKVTEANVDARALLVSVLASHITLLVDGVTHLQRGGRRMVYM